jgi:hypothetical protein
MTSRQKVTFTTPNVELHTFSGRATHATYKTTPTRNEALAADDAIRDLLRDHNREDLIELVVVQTAAAAKVAAEREPLLKALKKLVEDEEERLADDYGRWDPEEVFEAHATEAFRKARALIEKYGGGG